MSNGRCWGGAFFASWGSGGAEGNLDSPAKRFAVFSALPAAAAMIWLALTIASTEP